VGIESLLMILNFGSDCLRGHCWAPRGTPLLSPPKHPPLRFLCRTIYFGLSTKLSSLAKVPIFMASKDLDIEQLANYLHLTITQVTKMAVRGKIPSRKVNGEWRFSESEIHHWLEDQIGVGDAEELERMEKVLQRNIDVTSDDRAMLADYMSPLAIEVPLPVRTKNSVIREMCSLAERTGLLWDAAAMAEAVSAREELHPTALENGVALLHPRRPQSSILAEPIVALGISPQPIPFGNTSGHLTDVFFLICSTDDRVHLRILARLARLVTDEVFLTMLRSATSANEALETIRSAELELQDSGARPSGR
jgi:PTS system nitrogen regulatory IIA component